MVENLLSSPFAGLQDAGHVSVRGRPASRRAAREGSHLWSEHVHVGHGRSSYPLPDKIVSAGGGLQGDEGNTGQVDIHTATS